MASRKKPPKLILTQTALVHPKLAANVDVDSVFTRRVYNESNCMRCNNFDERHNYLCDGCPNYLERIILWDVKRIKGIDYVSVPVGHRKFIEGTFNVDYDSVNTLDLRATPEMPTLLEFRYKLFKEGDTFEGRPATDQVTLVNKWARAKGGFITAAPRSGKTVMATYIAVRVKLRTLVIAHESTLLDQFRRTFIDATDAPQQAKRLGLEIEDIIYQIPDNPKKMSVERIQQASVVLVNYQKFIFNKKRIKQFLHNNFGLLVVDEAHQGSASRYAQFINSINSRYRLALSATPSRKDGRHFVGHMLMGPVVAESFTSALLPEIDVVETKVSSSKNFTLWHHFMKFIETHDKRNDLIARHVEDDLKKKSHTCIIIPVRTKRHMQILEQRLSMVVGSHRIAKLHAGVDKEKILRQVETKKIKILIAIDRMIKQGVDFKRPTCLYLTYPMSDGNMFYQLANRPCTPVEGKRQPVVKYFLDNMGQSIGCWKSLFYKEINLHIPGNKNNNHLRYLLSPNIRARVHDLGKTTSRSGVLSNGRKI